jgi:hypothetical protein
VGALVDRRRNSTPPSVPDYDYPPVGPTTARTGALTEH